MVFLTIHSQFLVALIIGLFFPLGFPQMALNTWKHTEHLEIKTYKSTLIKVHFGWVEKKRMENNRRKIGVLFFSFGWVEIWDPVGNG